jgi:ribosome biogenesis protein Nip4
MKAKAITNFAQRFSVQITLNPDLMVEKNGRFYLVTSSLKPLLRGSYFVAGLYMGKAKEGKFFPSFNLLNMIAAEGGNRVVVDAKAAWLFICGRDLFAKGIIKTYGSTQKGKAALVLNEAGECLGFGMFVGGFGGAEGEVAVRNVVDVGDFLRREK